MTRSQGTAKPPGSSSGKPATGKSAAPGTQVTNLNKNSYDPNEDRNRDLKYQSQSNQQEINKTRALAGIGADFEERRERNINAPRQQRELSAKLQEAAINANAQMNIAGQQAGAQKYSAKEQSKAQMASAKTAADAQKFAAQQDTQARLGVAGMDQTARLAQTKMEERSNFQNMLGNLTAAMAEKNRSRQEAVISAATTAAGNATAKSNSDADRMADMYKSIMNTYNTGNQQFRYW